MTDKSESTSAGGLSSKPMPEPMAIVGPIVEGSIVLFANEAFDKEDRAYVFNTLKTIAGHDRFLIMEVGVDVRVGVIGQEDVKDALRQLVREVFKDVAKEGNRTSAAPIHGTGHGV